MMNLPKITIVTPTLNAALVLTHCLESIRQQNYDQDSIEIIIADGGSTDSTIQIAQDYNARVIPNRLKTAEAGKLAAVRVSSGDYIALIDSDNILPTKNWIREMVGPLIAHPKAVGSEPLHYTYRASDGFITRYCALLGMNDPLVHFLGNYDRFNLLTNTWTEVSHDEEEFADYLIAKFDSRGVPTIGANGTVLRANFLKNAIKGDYLFDIDILADHISTNGSVTFIKVKNGIIHTYCEKSVKKFMLKQRRRVKDFLYHKSLANRDYSWDSQSKLRLLKFIVYCILFVPLLGQALIGYSRKKDYAWFFHPIACLITLWEYGFGVLSSIFGKSEVDRSRWKQ